MVDVAVVGAGVVGLAVTDALVRRGATVRCVEAARPGHAQSGGLTRIFRHRHDDPQLVGLAVEARAAWRTWEQRFGRRLLGDEGALFAAASAPVGFAEDGVEHRTVHAPDLFGLLAPEAGPALFDVGGGALRIRRTIETLVASHSALIDPAEVLAVRPGRVITGAGELTADHVVVCAGAGTPRLAAGLGIDVPMRHALHVRPTFRVRDPAARLACWVDHSGIFGDAVYGSPVGTSGRYAVGLSGDDASIPFSGDAPRGDLDTHVRRVVDYVRRALPGLDPDVESLRRCVSTRLPGDSDGLRAWCGDRVTVFAGHNLAKFAPVLGERLADVALGGPAPWFAA